MLACFEMTCLNYLHYLLPKLPATLKNLLCTAGYIFHSLIGADKEQKEIDHAFLPLW